MTKIVTDNSILRTALKPTEIVLEDAAIVADSMFSMLEELGGVGLSANQVGIVDRICVVNVKKPIFFLNPVFVRNTEESVTYIEGCLSIPNTIKKPLKTRRSLGVTIAADNLDQPQAFGSDQIDWANPTEFWSDVGLLECIAIQHEIDHLNGFTIYDRLMTPPITAKEEPGRNEKVMLMETETGKTKFMKYKLARPYLEDGWEVV